MNIWLVSIFEQTPVDNVFSTRFINIANEAVGRSHSVTFFASTFKHNTKNQRFNKTTEVPVGNAYSLVFVKSSGYSGNVSLKRLWSHYKFAKDLTDEFDTRAKPDVILLAFPPVSVAYEVTRWAKKNDVRVVMDIIDPWPDIFRKTLHSIPRFIQNLLLWPMTFRLKKTLSRIDGLTSISNQYLAWARGIYTPLPQSECLYPAVTFGEMQDKLNAIAVSTKKKKDDFRVIYAGSLASSYDIPTILHAAKILNATHGNRISFIIAGVGPQEGIVRKYETEFTNLRYLGRLPKEALMQEYFLADLGLTQHVRGASQSVTYKLFDLLGAGLPILNSLESEMKNIILDNEVGLFNAPGDAKSLASNIEYFFNNPDTLLEYRKNSLALTARLGDSKVVYAKAVTLLESIVEKEK